MKTKLLILLPSFLILSFKGISQENNYQIFGMDKIDDDLYVHTTEVSVIEWLEFVFTRYYFEMRENRKAKTLVGHSFLFRYSDTTMLPDMESIKNMDYAYMFENFGDESEPINWINSTDRFTELPVPVAARYKNLKKKSLNHHLNMPIAGIDYHQAMTYCLWRTEMENFKRFGILPSDSAEYIIQFKLPDPSEHDRINLPMEDILGQNEAGNCHAYNHKEAKSCNPDDHYKNSHTEVPVYEIASFQPNRYNLHDVRGNLAEMTSVKGVAKGGSYKHEANECAAGKRQDYSGPETWLGFRCMAYTNITEDIRYHTREEE